MIQSTESVELMVCVDCLMFIANDDTSGIDFDQWSGIDVDWDEWVLAPGDDEEAFSTRPCGTCSSVLAGSRHEVIAFTPPHRGHFSHLGGTWWCDTCNSPYCDLA